jgi:hypothetical protein
MPEDTRIDINDLSLEAETLELDPTADAFQLPAPPPDGRYRVRLKLGERGFERPFSEKKKKRYITAHIEARIVAPGLRWDNVPLFDQATTLIMDSSGTCRMAGLLAALGEVVSARMEDTEMGRALNKHLAGEHTCDAVTQWEAYCKDCAKTVLRNERNFPSDGKGGHKHVVECRNCGNEVTAQARVQRYLVAA